MSTETTTAPANAAELLGALEETLRVLVTPLGLPDKDKGRTVEQQAALDKAQAAIANATPKLARPDAQDLNFLVIGRIIGDDEDTCRQIRAATAAQACAAYRAEMYALDEWTPEQIEQAEANGEGVLINHVFSGREALSEESQQS